MNKKTNKKILLAVMALISIFVWISNFKTRPKSKYQSPVNNKEIKILPSLDIQKRQKARTTYRFWKKDPFVIQITPVSKPLNQEQELQLTGIIYNKDNRYAIINNQIVRVSEKIDNYQVIAIKQDRVILIKDGIKKELKLEE